MTAVLKVHERVASMAGVKAGSRVELKATLKVVKTVVQTAGE